MTNARMCFFAEQREEKGAIVQSRTAEVGKYCESVGRDERGELSDGCKRNQERREEGRSRRGRAVNDHYLIRSVVSEGDGTIN